MIKSLKLLDLIVITILVAIGDALWWIFSLKALYGFVLFSMPSVLYLSYQGSKPWRKIFAGVITLGFLLGTFFEFFQSFNHSWIVDAVIPWKILNILAIDNILDHALMTLLVLVFYEYFLRKDNSSRGLPRRFYRVTGIIIAAIILELILSVVYPQSIELYYAYLAGGGVAMLVTIYGLYRHPDLISDALRTSAYFFFVWLAAEIIALKTASWSFQGHYVGWISILNFQFPFEEFFFWMLWYAPFLVVAYEFLMRSKFKKTPELDRFH